MACNCGGKKTAQTKYRAVAKKNSKAARSVDGFYRAASGSEIKDFPGTRGGELQALNWAATNGGFVEWIDKKD